LRPGGRDVYGHMDDSEGSCFHYMQERERLSGPLIWFSFPSLCPPVVIPTLPFQQLPHSPFQELLQQPAHFSPSPKPTSHTPQRSRLPLGSLPSISCQIPFFAPFMEMCLHATGRKGQQLVREGYIPSGRGE